MTTNQGISAPVAQPPSIAPTGGAPGRFAVDSSRVFTTGLMTVRDGRRLSLALFGTSLALGIVLVAVQGPALLVIGVLGLFAGYGCSELHLAFCILLVVGVVLGRT